MHDSDDPYFNGGNDASHPSGYNVRGGGYVKISIYCATFCSPRYSDDTRATLVISVQELHSTSANGMHSQHRVQYLRVFISLVTAGTIVRKH